MRAGMRASGILTRRVRGALTLIETLVAMLLTGVLLSTVYALVHACVVTQQDLRDRTACVRALDAVQTLMASDLRQLLAVPSQSVSQPIEVKASPDLDTALRIRLATLHSFTAGQVAPGEARRVTYEARNESDHLSLWRAERSIDATGAPSAESFELLAEELMAVKCELFDGRDWHDTWPSSYWSEGAVPKAVRLTLTALGHLQGAAEAQDAGRAIQATVLLPAGMGAEDGSQ